MLLWALFTCGFISGGVFAAFIFTSNEKEETVSKPFYSEYSVNNANPDPDTIFKQLTQINYQKTSGLSENSLIKTEALKAI